MNPKTERVWWNGDRVEVPSRDNQVSRLYRAERVAFGPLFGEKIEDGEWSATVRFVRHVESTKTWLKVLRRSNIGAITLHLADGRGCRIARGGRFGLVLPRWARTKPVILHEMAHAATPRTAHNWPFCAVFLELVAMFMGAEHRDALKASFKKHRVRFTRPRQLSPEVLAKLRAQGHRLAAKRREEQQ